MTASAQTRLARVPPLLGLVLLLVGGARSGIAAPGAATLDGTYLDQPQRLEAAARARLQAAPDDVMARVQLLRALDKAGRFVEAEAELSRLQPNSLVALLGRGDHGLYVGRYAEARRAFAQARGLAPRSPHPLWGEAAALLHLRGFDAALDRARHAVALAERGDRAHLAAALTVQGGAQALRARHGSLFDKLRHGPGVRRLLERAVQLDPDSAPAHVALGRFHLQAPGALGADAAVGRRHLARAVRLDPHWYVARAWWLAALRSAGERGRLAVERERYLREFGHWPAARAELRELAR